MARPTTIVTLSSGVVAALVGTAPGLPSDIVERLLAGPDPDRIRGYHDVLASQPHDAGTPGDAAVVDALAGWFESFGLEVEKQELHLYLSTPVSASVSILDPAGGEPIALPIREKPVEGDPYSRDGSLRPGWNAYAGSGTVEAGVVYANYGRLEDFERLEQLGVEVEGRIVLARYGGNYRGYKAKFAEEAGAAGLIIYTDPADSGWGRGLPWPEGGYANETHIQRGSIKTLDYHGDPLTPFVEATEDAERLDPAKVGLPTIPVQPVPWSAAEKILSRMNGPEVPGGWQGGLPMRYRLTGGENLTVRLEVEQTRGTVVTHNVMGTLRGSTHPDEVIIIGCHHDAWGFGASDPAAGMICVVEAARVFGELAQQGWRPARSIVFAGWAAEEHGIVGSVEYVESRPEWLSENAVAYLNLDMAAMGPTFRSAASPSLQGVIASAARLVPQPGGAAGETVWHRWTGNPLEPGEPTEHTVPPDPAFEPDLPSFGTLGGGSDHVGFLCHLCIPSASMGGGGTRGVSYHSIYDNLAWYRAVVGDDYEPARMVTQMTLAHGRDARPSRRRPASDPPATPTVRTRRSTSSRAGRATGGSPSSPRRTPRCASRSMRSAKPLNGSRPSGISQACSRRGLGARVSVWTGRREVGRFANSNARGATPASTTGAPGTATASPPPTRRAATRRGCSRACGRRCRTATWTATPSRRRSMSGGSGRTPSGSTKRSDRTTRIDGRAPSPTDGWTERARSASEGWRTGRGGVLRLRFRLVRASSRPVPWFIPEGEPRSDGDRLIRLHSSR
jgi:N-acetylated-alpha-linked acidic dipeptidase